MKKTIIGVLVGSILVFGWQSVSHMFLHYHDTAYRQIANQDAVIQTLSGIFKEEGQYLVPRPDPSLSQEEMQQYNDAMRGKPWAMITYHPSEDSDMGMAVLRGFTTAILSVFLFMFLIGSTPGNFFTVLLKGLAIGVFAFAFVHYNTNIWLQTPWEVIRPELIDLLIEWGLCGIWLGWWLNRKIVR